ncbi:MAG: CoA-binding protein [Gammaproteobacteria bacterium]
MSFTNPAPEQIRDLLRRAHTLAVVGLSPNPARPSFGVAKAMQGFGYRIIPVRPAIESVLGEKACPDLHHLPGPVDIVDVFRASDHVAAIVDDCIALRAQWLKSARKQDTDVLHGNREQSDPVSGARQRPRSLPQRPDKAEDKLCQGQFSAPALWLQEGVVDEAAALRAQEAGIMVVMDRCIYKDYRAFAQEP